MKIFSTTALAACLLTALPASAALVANWTFDDANISGSTVVDSTGGFNGTIYNGVTTGLSSPMGQAADFAGGVNNGNNQYVDLSAHTSSLSLISGSIAAWIKPESNGTTSPNDVLTIFSVSNGSVGTGETRFFVDNSNANRGNLSYGRRSATGNAAVDGAIVSSGINLFDGLWHHVAVTVTSTNLATIYVDGVAAGSDTSTGFLDIISANSAGIGRNRDSTAPATPLTDAGQWFFDGLIDDVRLYDNALSAVDVAALAVPEPSSLVALLVAGAGLALRRRR